MPEVVLIVAGATRLSTGYHLSKRASGRITVTGKGPIGDGSSSGAAGICTRLLWTETGVRVRRPPSLTVPRSWRAHGQGSLLLPAVCSSRTAPTQLGGLEAVL